MKNNNYNTLSLQLFVLTVTLFLFLPMIVNAQYAVGDKVTDFNLKDINGRRYTLYNYQGKVILLNFFTSW